MFRFHSPDATSVERFIKSQCERKYSYCHQGKTAGTPPKGFQIDHTRVKLGYGIEVFEKAKEALGKWQQFELGWVVARPTTTTIREGETVCVIGKAAGLYWLNAARIVYVIDDRLNTPKFGFAYGTLPAHMEMGEERFLVEMDEYGDVWYDILAFSRPKRWIVWLVQPYMRKLQKQFARDSATRMKQLVLEKVQQAA
ncbi:DUF1990 domain-containing protein [Blastopirellula marina]|uniref:DUF1990 domain-containing protein n=1 Tax=Blastopirellula marina TaxID=124 RepID=A0A2S8FFY6_9BACT|nr:MULTISPECIES: DUF1990 domain-containing protein [Pirellulaceae]PQO31083.1 DUF1990 domain-containing protein [Blastopirellula marina]RCS51477.1 DUF1990 domain-containing protein [Bremerella cremea]